MKRSLKVFVIHRWDMAEWQKFVVECLRSCRKFDFVDMSYPIDNPAPMPEFIQDYACGGMMDSDFVVVLPDTPPDLYQDDGDEYLSDLGHNIGEVRGVPHDAVYIQEIKTLMFDACDSTPALIVGFGSEDKNSIFNAIKKPKGIGGRPYNGDRFFYINFSKLSSPHDLSKMISKVLRNSPKHQGRQSHR